MFARTNRAGVRRALLAIFTCAAVCQAAIAGPPDSPLVLARQGYFYVSGSYNNPANPNQMAGQMYVEYQIPAGQEPGKVPIIMIHGGVHTGAGFLRTPDGRPGFADYYARRGWPVYVVDRPGVAKSTSFGAFGNPSNVRTAEFQWSAPEKADPSQQWPQAHLHTQWPGTGLRGDPAFDQYYAHLAGAGTGSGTAFEVSAIVALLEKIGPAVIMIHSASGPAMWQAADARPDLVSALVALEPTSPPFHNVNLTTGAQAGSNARAWGISSGPLTYEPAVSSPSELVIVQEPVADAPGLIRCWLQGEPVRRLPRLAGLPILITLGQASYHAPYDHCTSKYLTQAGVPNTLVRLENVGIYGNGHLHLIEKNNIEIAELIENWLATAVRRR